MLNSISGLIVAIAGLITSVTGLIGMVLVARRTSLRERDDAANRALAPPTQVEADQDVLIELHKSRGRRGRRRRER